VSFDDNSSSHPYSTIRSLPNGFHFVSGVLPYDADGTLLPPDAEAATAVETCVAELGRRLEAVGLSLADVVQTTVHLTDIGWRDAVNAAYVGAFRPPMPARTAIEVAALPAGAPVEIDAVAFR
jgi:enamine deaminase RidA (YjgF/YER057c/UK114 family)